MPRFLLSLLLLLAVLLSAVPAEARAVAQADGGGFASPLFQRIWSRTDLPVANGTAARSWVWGPQPGATVAEPFAGAPGGKRTVQYFDKARMEINPAVGDASSPWAATSGLLVVEMVSGRIQTGPDSYDERGPADVALVGDAGDLNAPTYASFHNLASVAGAPDARVPSAVGTPVVATVDRAGKVGQLAASDVKYASYSQETGHNVPDVFQAFLGSQGKVYDGGSYRDEQLFDPTYVAGYPISEAYWTTATVGGQPTQVLLQLYQRRVLTYIPGYSPEWRVQMGNVGQQYYNWRYSQPPAAGPTATPAANQPAGIADAYVRISGDQFTYAGQPVKIKGTNYWLSDNPFAHTWSDWDGPQTLAELEKARDLGVNAIRIGIPYDHFVTIGTIWGDKNSNQVKGPIIKRMTQLLQIASIYGMKVMFVLFDQSDDFPNTGQEDWLRQLTYIRGLVAPFVNDDRILAWDLHNEPENYGTWKGGSPEKVIQWVSDVAAVVHSIDNRHPLTVGVGSYDSLWFAPSGKTLLDSVDFVSFHCYDAGAIGAQIDAIKAHTSKPILLSEMGWPTGPAELSQPNVTYDEATQEYLYRTMLPVAQQKGIAGVMQWTLWDFPSGISTGYREPSYEDWFGLVRRDGSFKPAAADFRDLYPARNMPSNTATYEALTRVAVEPDK